MRFVPSSKAGDDADPACYRPITLLNTDYRLLAKLLAARLGPVLAASIGPEQTAFLPGRLMGDNVTFLQLLPDALRLNRTSTASSLPLGMGSLTGWPVRTVRSSPPF